MKRVAWALAPAMAVLALGCAAPPLEAKQAARASEMAIDPLRRGEFNRAREVANLIIPENPDNPYPHFVRAVAQYEKTNRQLALDVRTLVAGGFAGGSVNQKYLRETFTDGERDLARVDDDLAAVARRPGFSIELCPACWEIDWNGDGRVDERDRLLLQVEQDAEGHPIPEGDPRRKPTFRFDDGDVAWARAFVSFERAAIDVLLAYDWSAIGQLSGRRRDLPDRIVVPLVDRERIAAAKVRILEGLAQSDAARKAYLAETDDDREWVPNPRQKSHPIPLEVDESLYATWEGVVSDVRRLVQGEEGISAAELIRLLEPESKEQPKGTLDVGSMLSRPKDIVIDVRELDRIGSRDSEQAFASFFGSYYVERMKPSPLPARLARMKGEVDRHDGELGRKLRYLFWLN